MDINTILQQRYSCRAFLTKPVTNELLSSIFQQAQGCPSNCNVQPWQVLVASGESKDKLKQQLVERVAAQKFSADFDWSVAYKDEHRQRQFGSANALYGAMGIEREDKQARQKAMLRNWEFFDAPHVAFFCMQKYLNFRGAVDLGIYAQTLSLLLYQNGIASCMQGALGQCVEPVRAMFELPDDRGILFGMSFGYADEKAPANKARTERAELEQSVMFKY